MSTINFDHSKKTFHESIGIDSEQVDLLNKTLAEMSTLIVTRARKGESLKNSEIAELLANTLSYKELIYVATHGLQDRTESALGEFKNVLELASKRGVDFSDRSQMTDIMKEVVNKKESVDVRSIVIDPSDIDGSLEAAGVPDELKSELKKRILQEMKDRLSDQED
jgi:phage terminase large subunit-like protein